MFKTRNLLGICVCLALLVGAGPALSEECGDRGRRQHFLDRFDADGDGALSQDERRDAREARHARRQEHRQRMLDEFDADGDGSLGAEERQAARHAWRGGRGFRE